MKPTDKTLTVSELNKVINEIFKTKLNDYYSVIGEASNVRISKGHLYMTLKDEESIINVTSWNFQKNDIQINNGSKVKVYGKLSTYPKGGVYQLTVYKLDVIGTGDIYEEFNNAKIFYQDLGYFNNDIKIPLPKVIKNVGVITALDGAALQDFLYILEKKKFVGKIRIKNTIVQGQTCPLSVVNSLELLDKMNLDVIVITRGGGSFEDLCGFNDPRVIEAIHTANTCIISAVGHEVDTMLSDYVADVRAPTPSLAGELIANNQEISHSITNLDNIIIESSNYIRNKMNNFHNEINNIKRAIKNPNIIKNDYLRLLDNIEENIIICLKNNLCVLKNEYINIKNNLCSDSKVVLDKGYCMLVDNDNIQITSALECQFMMENGEKLKLLFSDGIVIIK